MSRKPGLLWRDQQRKIAGLAATIIAKTAAVICLSHTNTARTIHPYVPLTLPVEVTIVFQEHSPLYVVPEAMLTTDLRVSCLIVDELVWEAEPWVSVFI